LKPKIKTKGLKETFKRLKDISAKVDFEVKQATRDAGDAVASIAKSRAPVNTGDLRNSIQNNMFIDSENKKYIATIGSRLKYSEYVEFGTRGHRTNNGTETFRASLKRWAYLKGLSKWWYAIYLKIVRRGTKKQPYLLPAYYKVKPIFLQRIKAIAGRAGKK